MEGLSLGYYQSKCNYAAKPSDKYRIMVLPRMAVEACEIPDYFGKFILISITEPLNVVRFNTENPLLINYCRLNFFDLPEKTPGVRCFNRKDAKKVLNFIESHKDNVDTIIVHCHAGANRSSALAAAISKIYNGEDDWFFSNIDFKINKLVYNTVLSVYNGRESTNLH
jgi:predicted protein tyrosine phosphatase